MKLGVNEATRAGEKCIDFERYLEYLLGLSDQLGGGRDKEEGRVVPMSLT